MIFTDTFISELAVPPDLGVTYSPATIELATGHGFGSAWTGIDSVAWHGDPRMYVDVFDVPLARFRPGSVGAELGHFVRYEYRPTTSIVGFSDAVVYGDLRTDGVVSLDPQLQQDQFFGPWQTVRVYDRGECSAGENWRPILQAIAEGLDERILGALGQEGLDPAVLGNANLDPILRDSFAVVENTNDAFRIRRAYTFDTDLGPHGAECGGVLRIRFRGRFAGRDWRLVYILESVESVSVEIGEPCAGAGVGTTLEDTMRGVLESELESGITEQTSRRVAQPRPELRCRSDRQCYDQLAGFVRDISPNLFPRGARRRTVPTELQFVSRNAVCIENVCNLVPNVYRVHERPEGIEVVLSHVPGDPWIPVLASADPAMCDRSVSTRAPYGGFFGPVFDPFQPIGRRIFGDDL